VRDRDVRAEHIVPAQCIDEVLETIRLYITRFVVMRQAERGERGVVHCR
jgi:hypothetical protein